MKPQGLFFTTAVSLIAIVSGDPSVPGFVLVEPLVPMNSILPAHTGGEREPGPAGHPIAVGSPAHPGPNEPRDVQKRRGRGVEGRGDPEVEERDFPHSSLLKNESASTRSSPTDSATTAYIEPSAVNPATIEASAIAELSGSTNPAPKTEASTKSGKDPRTWSLNPITQVQVEDFWARVQSNEALEAPLDMLFDVDCYQNQDQVCIESCLYYCAMSRPTSFNECAGKLPRGCIASFGGLRLTRVPTGAAPGPWARGDQGLVHEDQTWEIKLHSIKNHILDLLRNTDVAFKEVYLYVVGPDSAGEKGPEWKKPGEEQDPIVESVANEYCGLTEAPVVSGFTSRFRGLGPIGMEQEIYGAREVRGILSNSAYIPRRGWRIFQEYFQDWELELLKYGYLVPLTAQLGLDDPHLDQYDVDSQVRLILTTLRGCIDDPAVSRGFNFIFVWHQAVRGTEVQSFGSSWGARWPAPLSEDCVGANSCSDCNAITGCTWCMTQVGQTCEAACNNGFDQPLPCTSSDVHPHIQLYSLHTYSLLLAVFYGALLTTL